jgi:hypothetical protein
MTGGGICFQNRDRENGSEKGKPFKREERVQSVEGHGSAEQLANNGQTPSARSLQFDPDTFASAISHDRTLF